MIGWNLLSSFSVAIVLLIASVVVVDATPCPKLCTGHGRCDTPSRQCQCFDGWYGADCSMNHCPTGSAWADVAQAIDDAHNHVECSNRGLCDYTLGVCECDTGFEGRACERKTCPNACNGHGRCQSMQYYASLKDPGEGTVYTYTGVWDADQMYGCNCDTGYFGPDCSQKECPKGDDSLTGSSIDASTEQFNEIQQVVCVATDGTFTLSFRGETSINIAYDASADDVKAALQSLATISSEFYDAVAVTFVGFKTKACTIAGTTIQIEFLQDFGDLPEIQAGGSKLNHAYSQHSPSITVTTVVEGTKENEWCSNRGLCDIETGVCNCMDNYDTSNGYGEAGQRGDCGYATTSITNCPGEIACSGHGVCSGYPSYRCECSNGWMGADCSEMTCPRGRSWFSLPAAANDAHLNKVECSDMGVCDWNYGICNCMRGFEGAACERLKCPGTTLSCNGHGECMTMALLATKATSNGVATPYTYGSIPNDPITWDFDSLQGCFCDDGFFGHDCSLRSCPTGDDPETMYQVDEVQDFYCEDDGDGLLTFTFREATTSTLPATATTAQLTAALEALATVRSVSISNLNTTDSICEVTGHVSRITFLTQHGDLPPLQISNSYVTATHVQEYLKGTKEVMECSGRGLCDYTTGICQCFTGYGSSDGMGGPGTYGDCGYQDPIVAPLYISDLQ